MIGPDNTQPIPMTTISGGENEPYIYPGRDIPAFSDASLADTEHWANGAIDSRQQLLSFSNHNDAEGRRLYLTWLTQRVSDEQSRVEQLYQSLPERPVDPLPSGSWQTQRNEGMWTCQIASAVNALNFLYPLNPQPFTERVIIEALGGQTYLATHQRGAATGDIARALATLTPYIRTRRTNSVSEMLQAVENGAAVMFPISHNHEALIPPGHRLRRGVNGRLEVQVADPLSTQQRYVSVDELIRSEITVAEDPGIVENSTLIIEKGITTVDAGEGIRTIQATQIVQEPQITTVKAGGNSFSPIEIVTVEPRKPIKIV